MVWLTRLWWSYVGPLLAMCHVSMTFSTFMIILATIERYLITVRSQLLACFRLNRGRLAIVMFLVALILRGSAIFEIRVIQVLQKFGEYNYVHMTELLLCDRSYVLYFQNNIYKVWCRTPNENSNPAGIVLKPHSRGPVPKEFTKHWKFGIREGVP